jgi:hypothetical protein
MISAKDESGSSQDKAKILVIDSDSITQVIKSLPQQNSAGNVNNYIIGCNFQSAASGRDTISTETGNVFTSNVYQQKWDEIKKEKNIDLSLASEHLSKIRQELKDNTDTSPEKELAICYIAAAENSANKKEGANVLKHLQKLKPFYLAMYPWAITFTASTTANIAASLIKAAFGIHN